MIKGRVSVIIPSRNEPYLKATVNDLLAKAKGDIEIFAILDGYWPTPDELSSDKRVNYIHFSKPRGMRGGINAAVDVCRGEYIMKSDAHCLFAEGFDEALKADHKDNWVTIPRRYALDAEKWAIEERTDNKYPIDVMRLDKNNQGVPTRERAENALIQTETAQGSCWFMKKSYYLKLNLLDEEKFTNFWHEMQEIGFKAILDGGKLMRNTKTWYAHLHKVGSRGYSLDADREKSRKAVDELFSRLKQK